VDGYGTLPLFAPPAREYEPFPPEDEPVDFEHFAHGSRIRRREVALVFNAIDSAEGLPSILRTLKEYGLRCTFFVNGEFIRSHPGAVKEIADSGHEVGSLFYVYFNMTDARYQVDRDFVIGGLARNEDDYFAATGKELSLVWHAPYYFVSSSIIDAAQEMNYQYVGRDVDSLDWVTQDAAEAASGLYLPGAELVERIIQLKTPGSIIPIRVGKPGERGDYLFQKLDVLINGLVAAGYKVVTATTLIQHAR
jgi:peptidoglycan/xylan/chitin deacetylase (PgdA/CDA1 family)